MLRKIELRRLTETPTSVVMAFDKKEMNNCGFPARGDYNVLYEDGKVIIVKELESVLKVIN